MNFKQRLTMLVLPVAMLISGSSYGAVFLPALDIQDVKIIDEVTGINSGNTGVDLTGFGFDIDATVLFIITGTGGEAIDITDESFNLTSTSTVAFDGMGSFSGSFSVGVDGGLLTGFFDNLFVLSLGGSDGSFSGDVTYTGGSLQGDLIDGRIEGVFNETGMSAKLGAVVPVPAAVWLFGSGLIGLVGLARRKA